MEFRAFVEGVEMVLNYMLAAKDVKGVKSVLNHMLEAKECEFAVAWLGASHDPNLGAVPPVFFDKHGSALDPRRARRSIDSPRAGVVGASSRMTSDVRTAFPKGKRRVQRWSINSPALVVDPRWCYALFGYQFVARKASASNTRPAIRNMNRCYSPRRMARGQAGGVRLFDSVSAERISQPGGLLTSALKTCTRSPGYLETLKVGAARIDLEGNPVGTVHRADEEGRQGRSLGDQVRRGEADQGPQGGSPARGQTCCGARTTKPDFSE
jgi:hypothetical protein